MVLRRVAVMGIVGGAVGLATAMLVARAGRALLFDVPPADPAALFTATAALKAVVLAAGYWPARRASSIDPTVALQCE